MAERMYERNRKSSHLATLYYEMDMLEFTFRKVSESESGAESPDWNLLIEGFLLHYRNLIEFFSGKKHRPNGSDISIANSEVWSGRKLTEAEMNQLQPTAQQLEDEYWTDISQFLQHCTVRRHPEFREWDIAKMFERLTPVLENFEAIFARTPVATITKVTRASSSAAGTATVTSFRSILSNQ
jgi:hypothetical protein